jgi:iron complex outermembrane receptor protein
VQSNDFTVAIRWKPIEDLTIRSSYGTGFLPPAVNQIAPAFTAGGAANQQAIDPLRGNTRVTTGDLLTGGNPNLIPERSKSWSAGLVITPRIVPNLRMSVDYVRIRKSDNIVASFPGGEQALLIANAAGQYASRVQRGTPSAADVALGWAGPIILADISAINLAHSQVEAIDTQVDYSLDTNVGLFQFFLAGTYQPHYLTQTLATDPFIENVGYVDGAIKYKFNAGLDWTRGPWKLGWVMRYYDSYLMYPATEAASRDVYAQGYGPDLKVPSQSYHDLHAGYGFRDVAGPLHGVNFQLGIKNVFDKAPPRAFGESYSAFGDPRRASYWLSASKHF